MSWKNTKMKAVTFSYDDGALQDVRLAELFNKYNIKATFNLNSEFLDTKESSPDTPHEKVYREDVKKVYEGHEVAVHTLTHPNLTTLDEAEIIRQVEEDRKNLEALAGYDIVGMAYPCGGVNNDDRVAQIIKDNTKIRYSRTITNTDSFDEQDNLYRFNPNVFHIAEFDRLMEMGQKFIDLKPDKPQIFYIWGHSYELDGDPSGWEKLEEFLKLISNRDDIFYGTNKQVLLDI